MWGKKLISTFVTVDESLHPQSFSIALDRRLWEDHLFLEKSLFPLCIQICKYEGNAVDRKGPYYEPQTCPCFLKSPQLVFIEPTRPM
jgi:hypothetical protein